MNYKLGFYKTLFEEVSDQIIQKINEKGWNVYEIINGEEIDEELLIRNNLVKMLKMNTSYRVYPKIRNNANNPGKVLRKLNNLVLILGHNPKITAKVNQNTAVEEWIGFSTYHSFVSIYCKDSNVMITSYESFLDGLDTIPDLTKIF